MFCSKCGSSLKEGDLFCPICGGSVEPTVSNNSEINNLGTNNTKVSYASFGKRFVAYILDALIVYGATFLALVLIFAIMIMNGYSEAQLDELVLSESMLIIENSIYFILLTVYVSVFHSSSKQATFGKMAMKIKVTDMDGKRITFGKAFLRELATYISAFTLFIGYLMAAFTEKKQALHDIMVATLVVEK